MLRLCNFIPSQVSKASDRVSRKHSCRRATVRPPPRGLLAGTIFGGLHEKRASSARQKTEEATEFRLEAGSQARRPATKALERTASLEHGCACFHTVFCHQFSATRLV